MEENESGIPDLERIMSVVRLVKNLSEGGAAPADKTDSGGSEGQAPAGAAEAPAGAAEASAGAERASDDEAYAVNAINAAIPYLDYRYRRPIGILIKMVEISNIINSYETLAIGGDNPSERKRRMLMAVRPELDGRKQHMLDIFVRIMEIRDIMEVMQLGEN